MKASLLDFHLYPGACRLLAALATPSCEKTAARPERPLLSEV